MSLVGWGGSLIWETAGVLREQITQPGASELREFLARHLAAKACLVQVFAEAEVAYQGRAASTADVGRYLVMFKQDGSLQIHHPKGVKPMNWQPRTDDVRVSVEGEHCVLLASRRSPLELVQVIFLEVELAQAVEWQRVEIATSGNKLETLGALIELFGVDAVE